MKSLDRWSADKLGIYITETYWAPEDRRTNYWGEWTLDDARCREIVREHFKINTSFTSNGRWRSVEMKWRRKEPDNTGSYCLSAIGKTIAEAEIACIEAIKQGEE